MLDQRSPCHILWFWYTKHVQDCGSDVGYNTIVTQLYLCHVWHKEVERYRVCRVCSKWFSCFIINQLLSITMVGSNQESTTHCKRCFHYLSNSCINDLHCLNCRLYYTCMSNHISVCI